jgi:hypothetical protein
MILIIGVSVMVFALVATATAYAVNGLSQSRQRSAFERSLAAAENGIDRTLAELSVAFTDYNSDYPVPSPPTIAEASPWCNTTAVTYPAFLADGSQVSDANGVFVSEDAERTWATQQLTTLRGTAGCVLDGGVGQYVVLKPVSPLVGGMYPKAGKVYAMGAVPGFGDPDATTRLVKNEYVFMPYRPTNAILTGAALEIGASVTITGAAGVDPTVAGIHTNGSISINGGSASTITGSVSQTQPVSGTPAIGGQPVTQQDQQRMPEVDARKFYFQAPNYSTDAMASWYDLCPGGEVRPYSPSGPCTSGTLLNGNGSGGVVLPFRGFDYTASGTDRFWEGGRTTQPGTYFAHHASIRAKTGGPDPMISGLTLIAEASDKENCSAKRYGNIDWSHHSILAPSLGNMFFYADGDVRVNSNIQLGQGATTPPVVSGMVVARDQIDLNTSSSSAVGAVVATDACSATQPSDSIVGVNSVTNIKLYYDPHSDAPFTSIITTSLWLDYSG